MKRLMRFIPVGLRTLPRAALALLLLAGLCVPGCYLRGWLNFFNTASGNPARVQDMRGIAVIARPAELLWPNERGLAGAARSFALSYDVVGADPRGGMVEVTVFLCPDPEREEASPLPIPGLTPRLLEVFRDCQNRSLLEFNDETALALAPQTFAAEASVSGDNPFGLFTVSAEFRLTGAVLDEFRRLTNDEVDLAGRNVHVVAELVRNVAGTAEVEYLYTSMQLRPNLWHQEITEEVARPALDAVNSRFCGEPADPDCTFGANPLPLNPDLCGNEIVDEGEDCDPPDELLCETDCTFINFSCLTDTCYQVPRTNQLPVMRGFDLQVMETTADYNSFLDTDVGEGFDSAGFSFRSGGAIPVVLPGGEVRVAPGNVVALRMNVEDGTSEEFQAPQTLFVPDDGRPLEDIPPEEYDTLDYIEVVVLQDRKEVLTIATYFLGTQGVIRNGFLDDVDELQSAIGFTNPETPGVVIFETPQNRAVGELDELIFVLTDDRGGVSWTTVKLRYQ